jgi:hypothetical protein
MLTVKITTSREKYMKRQLAKYEKKQRKDGRKLLKLIRKRFLEKDKANGEGFPFTSSGPLPVKAKSAIQNWEQEMLRIDE